MSLWHGGGAKGAGGTHLVSQWHSHQKALDLCLQEKLPGIQEPLVWFAFLERLYPTSQCLKVILTFVLKTEFIFIFT